MPYAITDITAKLATNIAASSSVCAINTNPTIIATVIIATLLIVTILHLSFV